jgi:hypothetical protein
MGFGRITITGASKIYGVKSHKGVSKNEHVTKKVYCDVVPSMFRDIAIAGR